MSENNNQTQGEEMSEKELMCNKTSRREPFCNSCLHGRPHTEHPLSSCNKEVRCKSRRNIKCKCVEVTP